MTKLGVAGGIAVMVAATLAHAEINLADQKCEDPAQLTGLMDDINDTKKMKLRGYQVIDIADPSTVLRTNALVRCRALFTLSGGEPRYMIWDYYQNRLGRLGYKFRGPAFPLQSGQ